MQVGRLSLLRGRLASAVRLVSASAAASRGSKSSSGPPPKREAPHATPRAPRPAPPSTPSPPPQQAAPPAPAPSPRPHAPTASNPVSSPPPLHAEQVGPPLDLLEPYNLSPSQIRQLEIYLDYMLEVNQSMNLTAVRDKGDAWERHIVDSLALLPVIERHYVTPPASGSSSSSSGGGGGSGDDRARSGLGAGTSGSSSSGAASARRGTGSRGAAAVAGGPAAAVPGAVPEGTGAAAGGAGGGAAAGGGGPAVALRLIDVGTGAGLPGMVLAAARPGWKITLLDSLRKRCDFLRDAAARAGLANVEVVWCRAEEGGRRPELRDSYDIAVARAVAEARVLAELCLPFVRPGGLWVAAKGPNSEAEADAAGNALGQLAARRLALELVASHSADGQRTALVAAKLRPTPPRFPRAPGTPSKKPL